MSTVSVGIEWSQKGRKPATTDAKASTKATKQNRRPNDKVTGSKGSR